MAKRQTLPTELVDPQASAYHTSLDSLRDVMLRCGFHVHRRAPRYATLQAYLGRGKEFKYPLFNPRFELEAVERETTTASLEVLTIPMVVITVLAKGEVTPAEQMMSTFASGPDCFCRVPESHEPDSQGYRLIAEFGLPVALLEREGVPHYDVNGLEPPIRRIHRHLS